MLSEIKIHRSLQHPGIVKFERYFEDKENVYILLELCGSQSLNELLKRRKRLTEPEVKSFVNQLVVATKHIHKHKLIHRE